MKYRLIERLFEDHIVVDESGKIVAEGIIFASCAQTLINQLNNDSLKIEDLKMFLPK